MAGGIPNGVCFKAEFVGCPQGNRLAKKSSSNLQAGWSGWRAASAQHDTPNWEIHWYPETSANKAKTKSLTRMSTAAEKAMKERDRGKKRKNRPQMPVAKKERAKNKCWWQTKNGFPNQSSKQLTPNERNKTAETTSKSQTVAYLQA